MAIEPFAPPIADLQAGRDFAAWLGLVPVQHSTRGKQRLGRTSKMGQRDIRRLLIVGAMAVIWVGVAPRCAGGVVAQPHAGAEAIDALANKMACTAWAMMVKQECYRDPVMMAAGPGDHASERPGSRACEEVDERQGKRSV